MTERHGLRGYIGSRAYYGSRAPQHIQNQVIREFCARAGKPFLLSATEYAMDNCYMILERVFQELPKLEGIVLFSIFMLPDDRARRGKLWEMLRTHRGVLYGAVENYRVETDADIRRIETILRLQETMPRCLQSI